jgi:hypothetical protein
MRLPLLLAHILTLCLWILLKLSLWLSLWLTELPLLLCSYVPSLVELRLRCLCIRRLSILRREVVTLTRMP